MDSLTSTERFHVTFNFVRFELKLVENAYGEIILFILQS